MIKCVIACEICISVIVILLWNIVSYFPLLVNSSGENYLVWFSLQHHSHFYSYRILRWSTASFLIVAYIIRIYICRFVTSGCAMDLDLKWNLNMNCICLKWNFLPFHEGDTYVQYLLIHFFYRLSVYTSPFSEIG